MYTRVPSFSSEHPTLEAKSLSKSKKTKAKNQKEPEGLPRNEGIKEMKRSRAKNQGNQNTIRQQQKRKNIRRYRMKDEDERSRK